MNCDYCGEYLIFTGAYDDGEQITEYFMCNGCGRKSDSKYLNDDTGVVFEIRKGR